MVTSLIFADHLGTVLAKGQLPPEVFSEGEHNEIRNFEISASVTRDGKVDHFIAVSPAGETIKGAVIQKPASEVGCFALDRLQVKSGDRITGTIHALTIKEAQQ